jgi:hypothetical protein
MKKEKKNSSEELVKDSEKARTMPYCTQPFLPFKEFLENDKENRRLIEKFHSSPVGELFK